jgi:F-type H+-transporting ATPase subunit epsilon
MTQDTAAFRCRVQTLQGTALACEAVSVVYPALDGLAGVLRRAGPATAVLGAGALTVRKPGGERVEFFVSGGFARIRDDVATILADECVPAGRLSAAEARKQLDRALAMPARTDEQVEARQSALQVARARLRLAQRAPT